MYDIIIIGAGPSGSVLAKLLNSKYKILLVDKNTDKEKCCGGLIAPDAQNLLASLDIGIPKDIISDPQLFYVRSIDADTKNEQNYQRNYLNVDRLKLDKFFREMAAKENVTIKENMRYISHVETVDGVIVTLDNAGNEEKVKCKLIVGADGANSKVRETVYHDFKSRTKYLSIQGAFKRSSEINHFGVIFSDKISDFYSWLIPKDDNLLIGGAFDIHYKPREKFDLLVNTSKAFGYNTDNLISVNACILIRPKVNEIKIGKGRTALIGEAAGFISPSSAEGFSFAYKSSIALSNAVNLSIDNWRSNYEKFTFRICVNIFLKRMKMFFMYNKLLRNMIFILGVKSIKKL
jgi:geranylgeranyl reductase